MGREIRRVPPNWEHPKNDKGDYQPMFDQTYKEAADEWVRNLMLWEAGEHPDRKEASCRYYWDWEDMPPDQEYYLPETSEEKTWYQVYETVSEGTPVTLPFRTKKEIVEALVHGDFWGYKWDRKSAEYFVEKEWAPSMIIKASSSGTEALRPHEINEDTV